MHDHQFYRETIAWTTTVRLICGPELPPLTKLGKFQSGTTREKLTKQSTPASAVNLAARQGSFFHQDGGKTMLIFSLRTYAGKHIFVLQKFRYCKKAKKFFKNLALAFQTLFWRLLSGIPIYFNHLRISELYM